MARYTSIAWLPCLILYIVSFVFTVLSLTSSEWAKSEVLVSEDGSSAGAMFASYDVRGPYHSQYHFYVQSPNTLKFTNSTSSASTICTPTDPDYLCQQLQIGTKLLIAGSALVGTAMFVLVLAFLSTLLDKRPAPQWDIFAARGFLLIGSMGTICEGFGGLIVSNVLVNNQPPDGNYITDVSPDPFHHHWMFSVGTAYVTVAFFTAVGGLFLVPGNANIGRNHHDQRDFDKEDGLTK